MAASCGGCYKPLCNKCIRTLKNAGRVCKHCTKVSEDKEDEFLNDGLFSKLRAYLDGGLVTIEMVNKVTMQGPNIHLTDSEARRLANWLQEHIE